MWFVKRRRLIIKVFRPNWASKIIIKKYPHVEDGELFWGETVSVEQREGALCQLKSAELRLTKNQAKTCKGY